jgi:hypothetical protein
MSNAMNGSHKAAQKPIFVGDEDSSASAFPLTRCNSICAASVHSPIDDSRMYAMRGHIFFPRHRMSGTWCAPIAAHLDLL